MNVYSTRLALSLVAIFALTGCLPKIDKELPRLSEYQSSDGWYEDAFIRIYKRDLLTGEDAIDSNFTHPWIVVKPSFSSHVYMLELTQYVIPDFDCTTFNHIDPTNSKQICGYIISSNKSHLDDLSQFEKATIEGEYRLAYTLGELRGGPEVHRIAEFILFESENYSCRNEYQVATRNSNTFVRALLEFSGFTDLYQQAYGEEFTLGNSSFGQASWESCPLTGAT